MPEAAALTPDAQFSDAKSYTIFLDQQPQTTKQKGGHARLLHGRPLTFRTAATRADRIGAQPTSPLSF